MRPAVKRRLVTLASVVSLLLCVAATLMWFLSYRYPIHFYRTYVLTQQSGPNYQLQDMGFDWANGLVGFFKYDERHVTARVDRPRELSASVRWEWVPGNHLQGKPTSLGFGKG